MCLSKKTFSFTCLFGLFVESLVGVFYVAFLYPSAASVYPSQSACWRVTHGSPSQWKGPRFKPNSISSFQAGCKGKLLRQLPLCHSNRKKKITDSCKSLCDIMMVTLILKFYVKGVKWWTELTLYLTLRVFFTGNSQQNHSTYQVNYTPADNAACCLTLILLSRSTLKIKAWLSSVDRILLISYSWDSLFITDQDYLKYKNKTHKCCRSALWNCGIWFQMERASTLHSRSHCNLHDNNDEQPIRDDLREKAFKFPFRCMLIVFIHGS